MPTASRSRSPNPTSRTIPACGCAAPAATGSTAASRRIRSKEDARRSDRDFKVTQGRRLHRRHQGHAHLSRGASSASPRRMATCSPTRSSICSASRRRCRTRRGSSPARWRGTGGTPTTSTASISSPASTPQTYKYYIDFAAKYGIEYIMLDEGWYKLGNVLDVVPEINMEELMAYAQAEERRHHPVGGLEDAGRPVRAGTRPVREVGHQGHQGRLHAARRSDDHRLLPQGLRARPRSAKCWSISTARSGPPP